MEKNALKIVLNASREFFEIIAVEIMKMSKTHEIFNSSALTFEVLEHISMFYNLFALELRQLPQKSRKMQKQHPLS